MLNTGGILRTYARTHTNTHTQLPTPCTDRSFTIWGKRRRVKALPVEQRTFQHMLRVFSLQPRPVFKVAEFFSNVLTHGACQTLYELNQMRSFRLFAPHSPKYSFTADTNRLVQCHLHYENHIAYISKINVPVFQ
jgi:hypothetical protein